MRPIATGAPSRRREVEAALAAHFGTPRSHSSWSSTGDTHRRAPRGPGRPGGPPHPLATAVEDELDEEDPAELVAASGDETDQVSAAEARLLEAFPGTSEVAELDVHRAPCVH